MSVCWGATDFGKGKTLESTLSFPQQLPGAGYDLANQTPYLDAMLRWGLDWLIKVCRLYVSEISIYTFKGTSNK